MERVRYVRPDVEGVPFRPACLIGLHAANVAAIVAPARLLALLLRQSDDQGPSVEYR